MNVEKREEEGQLKIATSGGTAYVCKSAHMALENRRMSIESTSASSNNTTGNAETIDESSPVIFLESEKDEQMPVVVQDPTIRATSKPGETAKNGANSSQESEEEFIDPAQLEQSWEAFKDEPLDRMLTVRSRRC